MKKFGSGVLLYIDNPGLVFFREKLQTSLEEYCNLIPEEYLNVKLTTQEKEELIKLIGFPKKWTSLKKALVTQGFKVEDKSTGTYRYSIISKKD